jgi:hypothetical protein
MSSRSRDLIKSPRIIRASLGLPLDAVEQALHPQLYQRLIQVPSSTSTARPPILPTKLVIEGEMVPYHEGRRQIDEFWKLAFAKASCVAPLEARSARWTTRRRAAEEDDSVTTGATPSPDKVRQRGSASTAKRVDHGDAVVGGNLHLMIVWFDVIVVDGESQLDRAWLSCSSP